MVNIRLAELGDIQLIKEYCHKSHINFPDEAALVYIAISQEGEIKGICALERMDFIEPLIADNPLVANNLSNMVQGFAIGSGVKKLNAIVDKDNVHFINLLSKLGFRVIENNKVILEKKIYGQK